MCSITDRIVLDEHKVLAFYARSERGFLHQSVLRAFTGAVATREVHCAHRRVAEHRHDWPSIILPILGDFAGASDGSSGRVRSPSAAVHPASGAHAAVVGPVGLDAVNIMLDPAWLPKDQAIPRLERHLFCTTGVGIQAARNLARAWLQEDLDEESLGRATAAFLNVAVAEQTGTRPPWIDRAQEALDSASPPASSELAKELGLHPVWMAHAFRSAAGEGLRERRIRRRVEHASYLLRQTDDAFSQIAAEAGFCDQSHMNRCMKALIGRSPAQVRFELR
jgi:AraC family transcriptional regulator